MKVFSTHTVCLLLRVLRFFRVTANNFIKSEQIHVGFFSIQILALVT